MKRDEIVKKIVDIYAKYGLKKDVEKVRENVDCIISDNIPTCDYFLSPTINTDSICDDECETMFKGHESLAQEVKKNLDEQRKIRLSKGKNKKSVTDLEYHLQGNNVDSSLEVCLLIQDLLDELIKGRREKVDENPELVLDEIISDEIYDKIYKYIKSRN